MKEVLVTPAIDIQIVFSANGERAFQVRFAPIPLDIERKVLDATLDMVLGAVERQRVKYELEDEQALLDGQIDRIRKYEASILSVEEFGKLDWEASGRRGDWGIDKLSPNAKNERERVKIALQNDRHDATARQEKIARLKEKMNGHAPDVGANHHPG